MDTINTLAVDPKNAAIILGVSRNTVYTLLRTGQLAHYRIGSVYRIDITAIEKYKQQHGGK